MKIIIILVALLSFIRCGSYHFSVKSQCDNQRCPLNTWSFNNTDYSYKCPQSGQFKSSFRLSRNGYIFDFLSQNNQNLLSIPLKYNQNVNKNGLQFIGLMNNNTQLVILNCTYSISKQYTPLCNSHELVGGKIINNIFQDECTFGLDIPNKPFVDTEYLPNQ